MSGRWTIREYRKDDEERIVPFFNEVFGSSWDGFEPRSVEFWKWQFEHNPAGHHTYVAEDEHGQLIGNYAAIRAAFLHNGRRRVGAQVVDTCVREDYRHTGLFIDLGRSFIDHFGIPERDFILFGYPNPPAMRAGTRHLGYRQGHCPIRKLVRVFDGAWVEALRHRASGVVASEFAGVDERVEALWARIRGDHSLTTWRDTAYLRWRYERHPKIRYRFLAVESDGEVRALVVFCLGWFGHPIVPLVDWIIPRTDDSVLAALLAGVASITLEAGGSRLETWVPPGSPEHENLLQVGFVEEETTFNLVFYSELETEWTCENWFYTMGDADFY